MHSFHEEKKGLIQDGTRLYLDEQIGGILHRLPDRFARKVFDIQKNLCFRKTMI